MKSSRDTKQEFRVSHGSFDSPRGDRNSKDDPNPYGLNSAMTNNNPEMKIENNTVSLFDTDG